MPWRLILSGWILSMRTVSIVNGFWDTRTCAISFRIWRTICDFIFATLSTLFIAVFWLGSHRFSWVRPHCYKSGLSIHAYFNLIGILRIMNYNHFLFNWFFSHRNSSIGGNWLWIERWSRWASAILFCNYKITLVCLSVFNIWISSWAFKTKYNFGHWSKINFSLCLYLLLSKLSRDETKIEHNFRR